MLLTSILVSAFVHVCVGRHVEPRLRIINGTDAPGHITPYLALVVYQVDGVGHWCGGTLIQDQYVLTAAHCLKRPKTDIDRVGLGLYNFNQSEPLQELRASGVAIHETFISEQATSHDIALIKLERPATIMPGLVENVKLLPKATFPACRDAFDGRQGSLYGWGIARDGSTDIPRVLQTLDVIVQSWPQCQSANSSQAREDGLCVARIDGTPGITCNGDAGGPLMVNGVQVGVIGHHEGDKDNCNDSPVTFFARTDYHIDWIKQKIEELK